MIGLLMSDDWLKAFTESFNTILDLLLIKVLFSYF